MTPNQANILIATLRVMTFWMALIAGILFTYAIEHS